MTITVSVSISEDNFELHLPSSANGKDLFDEAVASTGIEKDKDYFGLNFVDTDNQEDWLNMNKTILEQKINTNSLRFQLKIRFYPGQEKDLEEMEEVAMRLLFKQVCLRSCKNLLRQNIFRHFYEHAKQCESTGDFVFLPFFLSSGHLVEYSTEEARGVLDHRLLRPLSSELRSEVTSEVTGSLRGHF